MDLDLDNVDPVATLRVVTDLVTTLLLVVTDLLVAKLLPPILASLSTAFPRGTPHKDGC